MNPMIEAVRHHTKRLAFGAFATIRNSIRDSHLLTSDPDRKGYLQCPCCTRHEFNVISVSHLKCSYCGTEFLNYGVLGIHPVERN